MGKHGRLQLYFAVEVIPLPAIPYYIASRSLLWDVFAAIEWEPPGERARERAQRKVDRDVRR